VKEEKKVPAKEEKPVVEAPVSSRSKSTRKEEVKKEAPVKKVEPVVEKSKSPKKESPKKEKVVPAK
jgi:hypothetical protein